MIDRKKVIKGLEEISDYFFSVYHHSKDREEINKAKDMCDAVEDALALLKEQEAKPVKVVKNAYNHEFYHCPRCDRSFYELYVKPKFCDKCGQEVTWNA